MQASGQLRSDTDDIDVPAFFEIGTDPYYQNLLCEFTGILAVALQIERVHPHKWIGFQSWKATEKEVSCLISTSFRFVEYTQ
jgi:hypothetical protein